MVNHKQKSQFTPLTYILIGVVIVLIYLIYSSTSSPNDCKVATGRYVRIYGGPDIKFDVMYVLGEGDRLTLSSGKTIDWHIWQEVVTDEGIKGWAAENWKEKCK